MNKEQIKSFVLNNPQLVDMKSTSNPELFVLKYKKKVFYNNLWTLELLKCRGTVIDKDFNIVTMPFDKIFNYMENGTKIHRDELCTWTQKINGFFAAVTVYDGEILVSTTGSIDSDFVKIARRYLEPYFTKILKHIEEREFEGYGTQSFLFEICAKEDPHIIEEKEGAYLIGYRYNYWDSVIVEEDYLDLLAFYLGCMRPKWGKAKFSDILMNVKNVKHEGYMVRGKEITLKLKSPYYLSKKALMRMGTKQIDVMFDKPDVFRKRLDEEFYKIHSDIISKVPKEEWMRLTEQGRRNIFESYFEQKEAF